MAKLTIDFMSESLKRAITIHAVMPADHALMPGQAMPPANAPYKTLYYMEGSMGNAGGPLNYSHLQLLAEDYNLAVFVIGGENKWWGNSDLTEEYYGDMVTRDVVNFTRRIFNLSHKKEDTFIGGFSMGGHGAFVLGLRNPDLFGRVISLDASLQKWAISTSVNDKERWDPTPRSGYEIMFGLKSVEDWPGSKDDYEQLAADLAEKAPEKMPKIFMACGTADGLYDSNAAYAELLRGKGYDLTWVDIPNGKHNYMTIDAALEELMKWLPVDTRLHEGYPYYGPDAGVGFDNFNGWKTVYNMEAEMK